MTIVRGQSRPLGLVDGHLPEALIRTSRQETRAKKLCEHALAGCEVETPESGGLAYGHAEVRGVLEFFSNPLHKFAKEQGWHKRIRKCPERGTRGNRTGLRNMNHRYESAGRHMGVNARH